MTKALCVSIKTWGGGGVAALWLLFAVNLKGTEANLSKNLAETTICSENAGHTELLLSLYRYCNNTVRCLTVTKLVESKLPQMYVNKKLNELFLAMGDFKKTIAYRFRERSDQLL